MVIGMNKTMNIVAKGGLWSNVLLSVVLSELLDTIVYATINSKNFIKKENAHEKIF